MSANVDMVLFGDHACAATSERYHIANGGSAAGVQPSALQQEGTIYLGNGGARRCAQGA